MITGTSPGLTHNGGFGDDIIRSLDGNDTVFGCGAGHPRMMELTVSK